MSLQKSFNLALHHHQAGRLDQAEQLYRQILGNQPEHADATHLLGVLAHQTGRNELAADLIRRAIAIQPHFPEAFNNLGSVLDVLGKRDEAIAAYRQAIALNPGYAEAYNNLSVDLRDKGRLDDAIAASKRAVGLRPDLAEVHFNLGEALKEKGRWNEAAAAFEKAVALKPAWPIAFNKLGNARFNNGQLNGAIAAYRQAVALKPDFAGAHYNLGTALKDADRFDEAAAAYRNAIALQPDYADAHNNLGTVLNAQGRIDEAIAAYRATLALDPGAPLTHLNLGLAVLSQGDFVKGWEEHEWRWKWKDFPSTKRDFSQPQWKGEALHDRTLLIHAEQGYGDSLQFVRYIPLVVQRCARVIVECQVGLEALLLASPGIIGRGVQLIRSGQSLPAFDFHCPMLSLPRVFKTTLETIPADVPYLSPDPKLIESWRKRLKPIAPSLKVGIAWAGSPSHGRDRTRSISLGHFAPLAQLRGVKFFSLQKGPATAQAKAPPTGLDLIDWTSDLHDFNDSAALIANLDLIITVDTAVAHLAGALARPTWVLISFVPDWRWMRDRDDSPWYPSMRLFRQASLDDWDGVIARVTQALAFDSSG